LLGIAYCICFRLQASDRLEIAGVRCTSIRLLQLRAVYYADSIISHLSGSLFTTRVCTMYITPHAPNNNFLIFIFYTHRCFIIET